MQTFRLTKHKTLPSIAIAVQIEVTTIKMTSSFLFSAAVIAIVVILSKATDVAASAVVPIVESAAPHVASIPSHLLEAVLSSDIAMLTKSIEDEKDIDVTNVNGWCVFHNP